MSRLPCSALFMNGRRTGTSSRCVRPGSSAPNDVLTTPGCTALAVTVAASQPPRELVGEQDVGELGLVVGTCTGVGALALEVVEVDPALGVGVGGDGDHAGVVALPGVGRGAGR